MENKAMDYLFSPDITCDMCGKTFDVWDFQEDFGMKYRIGYGSKYDLHDIDLHFCCDCFDKILDFVIPRLKNKDNIKDYETEFLGV